MKKFKSSRFAKCKRYLKNPPKLSILERFIWSHWIRNNEKYFCVSFVRGLVLPLTMSQLSQMFSKEKKWETQFLSKVLRISNSTFFPIILLSYYRIILLLYYCYPLGPRKIPWRLCECKNILFTFSFTCERVRWDYFNLKVTKWPS